MGHNRSLFKSIILSAVFATIAACGGGGSGGGGDGSSSGVNGLKIAETMSIIPAQENNVSPVQGLSTDFAGAARAIITAFDPGSDYATDQTQTYVWDESMGPLQTVNMILCVMSQTGASEMVNQGAYIALVNEDKCDQGQNQSSAGTTGQSNGGEVNALNEWVVLSTRADNSSPQVVKIWVPGETGTNDPMDSQNILGEATITEGVSALKPFGSFSMNFRGVIDATQFGGATEEAMMRGNLRTIDNVGGNVQFEFVNLGGTAANPGMPGFSMQESANVVLNDAAGVSGQAKAHSEFDDGMGFNQAVSFILDFNATNVLRGTDQGNDSTLDAQTCLARDTFDTQVWRYNLYHRDDGAFEGQAVTAGERVSRNSGFPFTYTALDNNVVRGHASYWGLWLENEQYMNEMDGKTISQFDYDSDATTDYTVRIAPGKTIRRSAVLKTLSEFEGIEFNGQFDHPDAAYGYPNDHGFDAWVVKVQSGNFVVTQSLTWGVSGPVLAPITGTSVDTVSFSGNGETLWLWSDSLDGNVVYTHNTDPTLAKVTFYANEFVYPNDSTLFIGGATSVALYCYEFCPKGGLTQVAVDAMSSPDELLFPTDYNNSDGTIFHNYTLANESGKLILRDKNGAIVSTDGLNLDALGYSWGLSTGDMVLSTAGFDGVNQNPWEIYQASTSYRWETGSDPWNKLVTFVDASDQVYLFDRPLQFTYTVDTGDDINNDNNVGRIFRLDYGGSGDLWGFPWEPEAGCDITTENCRWYSAVNLENGVQLTDGVNFFVTKAIEREQNMAEAPGQCAALDVASLLTDTSLALPTADATTGAVSITWSGRPVLGDVAPAVIEGEVQ